jgi:hypothetical protein
MKETQLTYRNIIEDVPMQRQHSRRHHQRIDLDPPEVGLLFLGEPGYISGTSVASQFRKLFVDLIN